MGNRSQGISQSNTDGTVRTHTPYKEAEDSGNLGKRLALMEEFKTLPFVAVWDKFCLDQGVAIGAQWIDDVERYEEEVLLKRK